MDFKDLLDPNSYLVYWNESKENENTPFLGLDSGLFGSEVQLGDSIDLITGKSGFAPALLLNAPDSKTVYRSRGEIETSQKKIPSFKEGMQVDENNINQLMLLEGNPNKSLYNMVMSRIYNDSYQLYQSSRVVRNLQVMQLLSTGATSMSSNGSTYTVDYGIVNKPTLTSTNKWSDTANSDPIADIRKWKKLAKISGEARGVCSQATFDYIANNAKVVDLLKNVNGAYDKTDDEIKNFIYSRTQVRIYVDDTYYMDDNGNDAQFYPDNKFTLIPVGELGKIVYAITPEQKMLMTNSNAKVAIVDGAIAIVTTMETDAVSVMTKIAMKTLPRLDIFPDKLVIATVA